VGWAKFFSLTLEGELAMACFWQANGGMTKMGWVASFATPKKDTSLGEILGCFSEAKF